jgi:coproporphyrinogen III oxidase
MTVQKPANPPEDEQRVRAKAWFESLRDRICATLECLETEAPQELFPDPPGRFDLRPWSRPPGEGGGVGGFLQDGRLFEKACVHTSTTNGRLTAEMAKTIPGVTPDTDYLSTSISLIIHPRSPHVPTVHMNTRYFSTGDYWFGGGSDLTPMLAARRLADAPDTLLFHAALREACDAHDSTWFARYKAWCDEYFYLPHRKVTRGVGGIFYDRHNTGDFERDFAFTRDVGNAFLHAYTDIVRRRMVEPWTDDDRLEQLTVRGLYVEFNLLYDRGTTFGLKAGGNVETILSSMPPLVQWR